MGKRKPATESTTPNKKKAAAGKKRPASPTRPKGPRGNHALVITGLPPTPQKKSKGKRKQVAPEDDSEDEPEPPKKKMKTSKTSAQSERPKAKGAKPADPDPSALDRHSGPSTSGKRGRNNADPLSSDSPPSSSPSTSGSSTTSSSSSKPLAPPSNTTSTSASASSPPTSAHHGSSSAGSATYDNARAHPQHALPLVPSDALENALAAYKVLGQGGRSMAKTARKTKPSQEDEEDGPEEDEEDEEDEDDDDGAAPLGGKALDEDEGSDGDAELDAELEAVVDDDDNDDPEELSEHEVVEFIKFIRPLQDIKYALPNDKKDKSPKRTVTEHFKTWARHAQRLCGIYTDIFKVITTGMAVVGVDPKTAADYEDCYKSMPNMSAKSAKFFTKKFFHLCEQVPKFRMLCQHLLSRPRSMLVMAKFFQVHANAGRSSDIATLKRSFHSYLPTVILVDGTYIPPLTVNQYVKLKSRNAGYYSDCSARLILPINERDAFDEEPHEYAKRKNAQRKERERDAARPKKLHKKHQPKPADGGIDDDKTFPSFLFPTIQQYDNKNPQRGIFKSDLCVTVARHLFKGPSAVGRDDGLPGFGRACLADKYKIRHFTPDLLAYIATLIRHLLSIDARWQKESAERSGHHFHSALHTILSVDYEAWKEDRDRADTDTDDDDDDIDDADENIFSYYNRRIFGIKWGDAETQVVISSDLEDTDDEDNIRARMLTARKAELAARHRPRPKKGKERAASTDLRASEQRVQITRDSSIEFVEGPPPSDLGEGSAEGGAGAGSAEGGTRTGAGTSNADDGMAK